MEYKNIEEFLNINTKSSEHWSEAPKNLFHDVFGIDTRRIENLLSTALDSGGDYADVYLEYDVLNSIVLDEQTVKTAGLSVSMGAGIRVLSGDQTGYAHSESMDIEILLKAARQAGAVARNSRGKNQISLKITSDIENHYPVIHPAPSMLVSESVAMLQAADKEARASDKRTEQVTASLTNAITIILFANSDGRLLWDVRPMLRTTVNVILKDGDKYETANAGGGGRTGLEYFESHRIEDHAREAVRQAQVLLDAKPAPAGLYPVVLKAAQSGILLHEAIGHPLEADFNRKNTSAYAGRIGEQVASNLCSIVDDGTILNDRGSINFDDEGCPSQKNVLIEKGTLKGYMHDRISARHYKTKPTGNGRRESYQYFPIPRMTTTYMENGESDPGEIIKSVDKGIFCSTFKGGQVDISNGDFVFVPVEAYWIEKGKIQYPVKNFTLIGNGPDVLTKVSMVGNDFEFSDGMWTCGKGQSVPVGIGLPTIKIEEMTVGGQK